MKTGPRYCKGQPHNDFSCLQMGDHYQRGGWGDVPAYSSF